MPTDHPHLTSPPRRRHPSAPPSASRHRRPSADPTRLPLDLTTIRAEWRLRQPRV